MTNYDILLEKVRALGMDYRLAKGYIIKFQYDEEAFPVADLKQRKWAIERGFYPGSIALYDLTDDNWKNYLPNFHYFMFHPLNNHFKVWLGDKTTQKYILNSNGCEDTTPKYFVYIENNGAFTYLMDCPFIIKKDEDFLLNLLKEEGTLAMKPNSGTSGGRGFIKMEYKNGEIWENNKLIDMSRFKEIRDTMRNYVITEYCRQHPTLAQIWPDSECTLRVIMFRKVNHSLYKNSEWKCLLSYARFGTKMSGGASNLSSGGVGIGFDFETGMYNDFSIRYKRFCEDGIWKQDKHPDTCITWKGNGLPNWDFVKKKILQVCQHISSLEYLGFDVIITESGMKLCEINTHPALDYEQVICGPVLVDEDARKYFESKETNKLDCNSLWKAYVESQK